MPFLVRSILCSLFLLILFSSALNAGTTGLPVTGQVNCYDMAGTEVVCSGTGQDGELQAGVKWPVPRFTDNGDGTITDNLTGLMWLKDAACLGREPWSAALDKVSDFNVNPEKYNCINYSGLYYDWRMANLNEMMSLKNRSVPNVGDWLSGEGFVNLPASLKYSTSTSYFGNMTSHSEGYYWYLNFNNPQLIGEWGYEKTMALNFWPVRGDSSGPAAVWRTGQVGSFHANDDGANQAGVKWPTPRFTDNGDGTITDNLTHLMWTKNRDNLNVGACNAISSWQGALDQIKCLNEINYLGYSDWRLANIVSLRSLRDYSVFNDALPKGHPFTGEAKSFWSSTTCENEKSSAWHAIFDDSHQVFCLDKKKIPGGIWPVREAVLNPVPHIRANGSEGPLTVSAQTVVNVTISLDAKDWLGSPADWWIYAETGWGTYWYVLNGGWKKSATPLRTYGNKLVNVGSLSVLKTTLPKGAYNLHFSVDHNMDNIPDNKWTDSVLVTVQ